MEKGKRERREWKQEAERGEEAKKERGRERKRDTAKGTLF